MQELSAQEIDTVSGAFLLCLPCLPQLFKEIAIAVIRESDKHAHEPHIPFPSGLRQMNKL